MALVRRESHYEKTTQNSFFGPGFIYRRPPPPGSLGFLAAGYVSGKKKKMKEVWKSPLALLALYKPLQLTLRALASPPPRRGFPPAYVLGAPKSPPSTGARLARARSGGVEFPVSAPAPTAGVRALALAASRHWQRGRDGYRLHSAGKSTLPQRWDREKAHPQVALGDIRSHSTHRAQDHTITVRGTLWPL